MFLVKMRHRIRIIPVWKLSYVFSLKVCFVSCYMRVGHLYEMSGYQKSIHSGWLGSNVTFPMLTSDWETF